MIVFKSLRWKNFLSTGNNWTEIQLNKSRSTLIVGQNGAGKSTMLDALSFALFGRAHRNINKPQLVNTINNKDSRVEVEFQIGKSLFKVVRGIKPNIFEIWKNGDMMNQSSHSKEYQKILEQNIIKLNHKSFHQIVVLGSSSFIPFMQLPAQHRRDVIEDLLDINIFSKMNVLVKEKNIALRDKLKDISNELTLVHERIELQNKYIKEVKSLSTDQVEQKETEIFLHEAEIKELQHINKTLSESIETISEGLEDDLKNSHDKKQNLLHYKAEFNQKIRTLVKDSKFYEENDTCPTCSQDIDEELKNNKLSIAKSKALEFKQALNDVEEQAHVIEDTITELNDKSNQIREHTSNLTSNNKEISRLQSQIETLSSQIRHILSNEGDMATEQKALDKLNEEKNAGLEEKLAVNEEYSYNTVISEMLKDTGIKTKIIKQYLPVINKLTNQYLQVLDFFVHFNLDESFQETIRSRHRDSFSYDSFSEGEKQRIDLALLFTWRQIAKMKNSVSTNLLILDETFDSSLDHDGVDNLIKILYTLDDDTNVFVISHKGEILDGKFKDKLEFYKDKNFSKMKFSGSQIDELVV
jgi:DNA repair exonuclease SbcCD ATPase subunit|tara:strand:+ start:1045 stop:2793 length:1749 start_codon:yes stop_codon:yes gene_type:complete